MPDQPTKTVLVVDDDPILRSGIARELMARDFGVRTAANGDEALEAAHAGDCDVLLLDVELPGQSAADVLRELRASPLTARMRVVLMAETGDSGSLARALRHGADGVIHKDRTTSRDIALEMATLCESGAVPVWADSRDGRPVDAADVFQTRNLIEPRGAAETAAVSQRRFGPRRRPASADGGATTRPIQRSVSRDITSPQTVAEFEAVTPEIPPVGEDVEREDAAPAFGDMARGLSTDAQVRGTGEIRLSQTGEIHLRAPPPRAPGRGFGNPEHDVYAGVVNPLIGGVARLAEALGLPANLTCPRCKVQILLHMSVDDLSTRTVKGHFACPKCGSR